MANCNILFTVSFLNIEVLSKYTSELEESSIEYDHCLNCKGLIECKNKICGYAYLPNKKDVNDSLYRDNLLYSKFILFFKLLQNISKHFEHTVFKI